MQHLYKGPIEAEINHEFAQSLNQNPQIKKSLSPSIYHIPDLTCSIRIPPLSSLISAFNSGSFLSARTLHRPS